MNSLISKYIVVPAYVRLPKMMLERNTKSHSHVPVHGINQGIFWYGLALFFLIPDQLVDKEIRLKHGVRYWVDVSFTLAD